MEDVVVREDGTVGRWSEDRGQSTWTFIGHSGSYLETLAGM